MTNLDFSHCEFNIHESEFKLIYNLPYNIPKSTFINGNFDFYLKKKKLKLISILLISNLLHGVLKSILMNSDFNFYCPCSLIRIQFDFFPF